MISYIEYIMIYAQRTWIVLMYYEFSSTTFERDVNTK